MSDLIYVVATPFKNNATSSLPIKDFEFALSFDLKWMSPDQACRVRDMAIRAALLKIEDGKLTLTTDPDSISIPSGFKPSADMFREKVLIDHLVDVISASTGMGAKGVASAINDRQSQLSDLVGVEVAALLVAREMGCDIDDIYGQVYEDVIGGV
ncbi:MAG: DUF2240 family protein [Methanosarcinaceae archaeon]|nr:DUF2240 family protein [Methanosarcinaceae archaeon]